jgi:lysylphosphatidylglycerol synthetase-like protein (DUF2156 family)
VPAAAAGAWAVAIAVGVVLHDLIERMCPPEDFVSGLCTAPWFPFAERVVFCVSAALAAGLIVVACTFAAPRRRTVVAVVVLIIGTVAALAMAIAADAYLELLAAVGTGALAVWWLRAHWRQTTRH